jgi:hypothetical protein
MEPRGRDGEVGQDALVLAVAVHPFSMSISRSRCCGEGLG